MKSSDPIGIGKRTLYLTRHRGDFFKKCPASPGQVCCGYWILNLVNNCPFDCTYCILQSYLNFQPITVYVNFEDAVNELKAKVSRHPERLFRIGTGELGDSLALDPLVPMSRRLVLSLYGLDNVFLELKTKSVNVEDLLGLDHDRRVAVSWSLGPDRVVKKDEPGSMTVNRRIDAAKKIEADGYLLGFHFDPIIRYPGWENDYKRLIDTLFASIDQGNVIWISLGCLRYPPELKGVTLDRFLRTKIFHEEFVPCPDGKMRYLRMVREEIYGKMLEWIRERAPSVEVYLCMESALMWENVFGLSPDGENWLSDRLERAVLMETK
jgi:spore photoproduct lyase